MTEEFQRFVREFIETSAKDGLDLSLLDALSDSEKIEAIRWLIDKITSQNICAVQALSYLKAKEAVPKLKQLFSSAGGYNNVYICEVLWNVDEFEPALVELCRIATHDSFFGGTPGRETAISMLGGIRTDLSERALVKLISHRRPHIRLLAVRSLARLLGMIDELRRLDESVSRPFESRQRTLDEVVSEIKRRCTEGRS